MKCPHCNKEVFGKCHDVSDLYEETTQEEHEIEQLRAENEHIKEKYIALMNAWIQPNTRRSMAQLKDDMDKAYKEFEQALKE